jgi:hypothetical protein
MENGPRIVGDSTRSSWNQRNTRAVVDRAYSAFVITWTGSFSKATICLVHTDRLLNNMAVAGRLETFIRTGFISTFGRGAQQIQRAV